MVLMEGGTSVPTPIQPTNRTELQSHHQPGATTANSSPQRLCTPPPAIPHLSFPRRAFDRGAALAARPLARPPLTPCQPVRALGARGGEMLHISRTAVRDGASDTRREWMRHGQDKTSQAARQGGQQGEERLG